DSGQATLQVTLGVGNHALKASFAGTAGFTNSVSPASFVTVHRAATAVTLTSSANSVFVRQPVTFTATVRDPARTGTPTGTVTFLVGNVVVARVRLDANGHASIRGFFLRAGRFTIRAVYSGDADFAASSQSLTEQVNR